MVGVGGGGVIHSFDRTPAKVDQLQGLWMDRRGFGDAARQAPLPVRTYHMTEEFGS